MTIIQAGWHRVKEHGSVCASVHCNDGKQRGCRRLSSRADITPNSFTNPYDFGDLHGNPRKLMEFYFDGHVYVSNFGTVTFMLRLPRAVLPDETLAQYATNDGLDWWTTDEHTILQWRLDEEPAGDWMDREGWMGQLLPRRIMDRRDGDPD